MCVQILHEHLSIGFGNICMPFRDRQLDIISLWECQEEMGEYL